MNRKKTKKVNPFIRFVGRTFCLSALVAFFSYQSLTASSQFLAETNLPFQDLGQFMFRLGTVICSVSLFTFFVTSLLMITIVVYKVNAFYERKALKKIKNEEAVAKTQYR